MIKIFDNSGSPNMGLVLIDAQSQIWEMIPNDQGYQTFKIPLIFTHFNERNKRLGWMGNLPKDLISYIMTFHVDYLLKQAKFKEAMTHILHYEPLLTKYYNRYVGAPILKDEDLLVEKSVVKRVRLENVFDLADCIFNLSLIKPNGLKSNTYYFDMAANCNDFGTDSYEPHKIFSKFGISLMDLPEFYRLNSDHDLLTVTQGDRYIDTIWLNADQQNSEDSVLMEYYSMERPVIVLAIIDTNLNLLSYQKVRRSIGWRKLNALLHHVGGPETAVYICDQSVNSEYYIKRFYN